MVLFNDDGQERDELVCDEHSTISEDDADASIPDSLPPVTSSPTCSQLFLEVRSHAHAHPVRIDLAVSHSISSLTREVDSAGRNPPSPSIPTRSVSSLRSLFDLTGASSTYSHGRELGGRSSVLALQVPASSLPPPLTASAIVDSFHMTAPNTFFSALPRSDETSPLTRESLPCRPCEASHSNLHAASVSQSCTLNSSAQNSNSCAIGQGDVARRLTEVFQDREDEALVLPSTSGDNMVSQWLQALEVHVVGACRADERLQPILRWNSSCSGADRQLLAHLGQHFKIKELGALARCLCAPLVSIRVGKVQRQGRLLHPTASRGYLSLSMLPTSEMRLSFIGDNGEIERMAAIKSGAEDSHVSLDGLDADSSGRSFVLRISSRQHFFWQSEKSIMDGTRLVAEMKDYFLQRPTLSQLTGVHESRLDSFVFQLRTNLDAATSSAGFQSSSPAASSSVSSATLTNVVVTSTTTSSSTVRQSPLLSPRASGFKEGTSKGLTNMRSHLSSREKHRRRLDKLNFTSVISTNCGVSNLDMNRDRILVSLPLVSRSASIRLSKEETASSSVSLNSPPVLMSEVTNSCDPSFKQATSFPMKLANSTPTPTFTSPVSGGSIFNSNGLHVPVLSHVPIPNSTFLAPYYCPCPLRSSALQYTLTPPFLPPVSESSNTSPSSFFSLKPSSAVLSQTTLSLDRVSITPIPLPVSSVVNIALPVQTSSLSSFFSDPIVHIPVIDIQSANKGFRVSAPPPVSTSGFPAVLPSFLSSIFSGGERSIDGEETPGIDRLHRQLEDNDREHGDVLPLLLNTRFIARHSDDCSANDSLEQVSGSCWSSSVLNKIPEFNGPILGMVPALLTSGSLSCVMSFHQEHGAGASSWVSGSRGLYGGTCEPAIPPSSIANCITSVGLRITGTDGHQMTYTDRIGNVIGGISKAELDEEDSSRED